MAKKRLVVIEDDASILDAITDLLFQRDYLVVGEARNLADAMQLVTDAVFDCAIVDLKLFGQDAASVVLHLQTAHTPFVLISGTMASDIETPWLRCLPQVRKPFGSAQLIAAIEGAMARVP